MPAPSTPVLDNFTGTAGTALPTYDATNWGQFVGAAETIISPSGTGIIRAGGGSGAYWKTPYSADQDNYMTMVTSPVDDALAMVLYCRLSNPTNPTTAEFYRADWTYSNGGADTWEIQKVVGGVLTSIASTTGHELLPGEKVWFNCTGTTLTIYVYTAGAWTQVLQTTDSDISGGGYLAHYINAQTQVWDDFGGGTAVAGPANVTTPVIIGDEYVGQTLLVTDGDGVEDWTDEDTIVRQWQRETAVGSGTYVDIAGETGATYVLVNADRTLHVRVKITAENAGGETDAFSAALGPIGTSVGELESVAAWQAETVIEAAINPPGTNGGSGNGMEICNAAIHLCRVRVTRLSATGEPLAGPNNVYVTDKPLMVSVTPEVETGEDKTMVGGCDCIVATYRGYDKLKRFNLEMDMAVIEPGLLEMLTGGDAILDGDGDPKGVWWPSQFNCSDPVQPNVAFEGWQDLWEDDHPASSPNRYVHWIWPSTYWQIGEHSLQNDFNQPKVTGFSRGNPNWGEGIFGDLPEPAGALGGFFYDDAIPDAACGWQSWAIT